MLNADTAYPVKRFALKVVILSIFGLMQWRGGISRSLLISFVVSGILSTWLAVRSKADVVGERHFTYWDEAAGFFTLSALVGLVAAS